jgi:hypothetical protein
VNLLYLVAEAGQTSCIPPLVIAWDPTFGQERIWSATNPVTVQTDGVPWTASGGNLAQRFHPPIVIISDPRCHYQLLITPAYKLACFRLVATNAPCVASFSVALVLFILALQANATRRGEAVPSPLTALRTIANLQNQAPLSSAAVASAALLYPLFQSSRAHVVFLMSSALLSLALAFGLVTLLAVTQAGFLGVGSRCLFDSGKSPESFWGRFLRGSRSRAVPLVLGSLSVVLSLLYHPGLALLLALAFQSWEALSALACCCAPVVNDGTGLGKSGSRTGSCSKRGSTVAGNETPIAPSVNGFEGVSSAAAMGAALNGAQSIGPKPARRVDRPANDEHRAYLQRQSARILLTFHSVAMVAPAISASLLRTSGMRKAPGALDSLLVLPQIIETFLVWSERFDLAGASARREVPASVAVSYLVLGLYVFHGGVKGKAHRISFACVSAATVNVLLAVSRKLST